MDQSERGKLNIEDLKKLGKSAGIAFGGAALVIAGEIVLPGLKDIIDVSYLDAVFLAASSWCVNFGMKLWKK